MKNDLELTIDEANDIAEKGYKTVIYIYNFMNSRFENSIKFVQQHNIREKILLTLWSRSFAWMKSLTKLDQMTDFQAITVGSRTLLEIYIDMVLIIYDKSDKNADKLYWWNESEKLKAVELQDKYLRENNLETDNSIQQFIQNNKTKIETNRLRIWGNCSKHPKFGRWTGNDLIVDAKKADSLCSNETNKILGKGLENYCETEYRKTHWNIHSGITSTFDYQNQHYSLTNWRCFWNSSSFALLCTRLLLIEFGFAKVLPNFEDDFERINLEKGSYII